MKVTVIGNGISRTPIPLHKIPGVTVGCNEVYKEFDCQVGRVYGEHTPPSSFQRWVDTLIHQADKYPVRRIVGENSLDIPEIKNTISVQDYINELERKLHYGDISSTKK